MCSKIFRTRSTIYTVVVVAQRICHNWLNCEFPVLLRSFVATASKRAKTTPPTLATTDLAASPWQRPFSHFRFHPPVSGKKQNCPPYSPDLAPCDFFLFPKLKFKLKGAGLIPLRRSRPNRKQCLTLWQKRTTWKRSKNGEDGVFVRVGTTSRVAATDRLYGEFYDFYSVSPENFESTLVRSENKVCPVTHKH